MLELPTNLHSRAMACYECSIVGACGDCFDIISLARSVTSFLSPCLWETPRLKYCLEEPLTQNNQPTKFFQSLEMAVIYGCALFYKTQFLFYFIGNSRLKVTNLNYDCEDMSALYQTFIETFLYFRLYKLQILKFCLKFV